MKPIVEIFNDCTASNPRNRKTINEVLIKLQMTKSRLKLIRHPSSSELQENWSNKSDFYSQ